VKQQIDEIKVDLANVLFIRKEEKHHHPMHITIMLCFLWKVLIRDLAICGIKYIKGP
jgi:hypothetical protein